MAKVFREVVPDERAGRGRFWRPDGAGYTDDITQAGLYEAGTYLHSGRTREVDASAIIHAERDRLTAMLHRLDDRFGEAP